jgi:5-methylcytosine-specific restriction endonuclease McrA
MSINILGAEMAKEWSIKFYNSKAWKKCRAAYIKKVFGLCERCPAPGYIVHHKVYLTPTNINDPAISLNHDLLEYVCQDCHNKEHHGSHEPVTAEGLAFDSEGNLIQVGDRMWGEE